MKKPPRVERDRLRERERQARAQMSSQVAEQEGPVLGIPLFGELVKVTPSATDPVTQQIQSKLGDFQRFKPYLDHRGLIGVEGGPQGTTATQPRHHSPISNVSGNVASRLQPSPESRPEFKKPQQHPHPHQRGGYVKPADGKPPYEGRGGYPGQPVKHGSGINSHRSNGILPAKGPPLTSPNSTASLSSFSSSMNRTQCAVRNSHIPYEQSQGSTAGPKEPLPSSTPNPDMENIFKEMIVVQTPLTAIAATPRTEPDNKFVYNSALAKLTENTPAPSIPSKSIIS